LAVYRFGDGGGVLIAWRWEMLGGTVAVISATAMSALVYFGSGRAVFSTAFMISVPFFVAGVLFLACYWRTRQDNFSRTPEPVRLPQVKAELRPAATDMVPETTKQAVLEVKDGLPIECCCCASLDTQGRDRRKMRS
jgi:hypothetical protein